MAVLSSATTDGATPPGSHTVSTAWRPRPRPETAASNPSLHASLAYAVLGVGYHRLEQGKQMPAGISD